jgi:hypothetical protein
MTQEEALEILKMGHNVFLTGSAGSGKTFVLNKYIQFLRENKVGVGVTASTGIAATHMNGMTIHSWSGLGILDVLSPEKIEKILKKSQIARRFKKTKVLIIDEVSMLHSFRLDILDELLKSFFENELPFGGLQVVLCGDFFQLPPISQNGKKADFVNKSNIWENMELKVCYLNTQYRQKNDGLLDVLESIRMGNAGEETLLALKERYNKSLNSPSITKLHTHNFNVDMINDREINKLSGDAKSYQMQFSGNKKLLEFLKNSCLSPERLILKKSAFVMFTKNNFENGYVNGTLGEVVDFSETGLPIVKTLNGKEILAEPEEWTVEEDGKVRAQVRQIPLRLAWAITIHKSQGMTLDAAEIDLSRSFVEGMGYVALSRVSKLSGLSLLGLNEMALKVNEDALAFDKELKKASEKARESLKKLKDEKKKEKINKFVGRVEKTETEHISTLEKTKQLAEKKMTIKEIAKKRGLKERTVVGYMEKLMLEGVELDLDYLKKTFKKDRLKKIKEAFEESGDTKLLPVREILGKDFSFDEIRIARLLLNK